MRHWVGDPVLFLPFFLPTSQPFYSTGLFGFLSQVCFVLFEATPFSLCLRVSFEELSVAWFPSSLWFPGL